MAKLPAKKKAAPKRAKTKPAAEPIAPELAASVPEAAPADEDLPTAAETVARAKQEAAREAAAEPAPRPVSSGDLRPPTSPVETAPEESLPEVRYEQQGGGRRDRIAQSLNIAELQAMDMTRLNGMARQFGVENYGTMRKHEIIYHILQKNAERAGVLFTEGVLEVLPEGFGFLRSRAFNYLPCPEDVYVSPSQIRRFDLQTGNLIAGQIRPPKEKEKFFALLKVEAVDNEEPEKAKNKTHFDNLTPLFPNQRFILETTPDELNTREAEALIDDLALLRTRLLFSGGEPLMREDLPHLIRYAHDKAVPVGLVSNGFLVPSLWPRLREVPWFLFFTSLDGPADYHDGIRAPGSFDRVMRSLELFARHQTPVLLVNTVVHQDNLALLPVLHEHLRAHVPTVRWHLTPVMAVGRNRQAAYRLDADNLRELAMFVRQFDRAGGLRVAWGESHSYLQPLLGAGGGKPFFCGAGLTRCSIMPDGSVVGCHQAYDPTLTEGNIRQQSFSHIWRHGFARFRPRDLPAVCAGCAQAPACGGGCWAEMQIRGHCWKPILDLDAGNADGTNLL